MIVNTGKIELLESQYPFLADCKWKLFTDNETITAATVLADLVEAAFTGYADVTVGSLNPATIIGGRASAAPVVPPVFTNAGSIPETVYGWYLVDSTETVLIAAVNMGTTTIPAGQNLALAPVITDTQE